MEKLSISFTLGKASHQHSANVEHNNRKFIASNVNANKISENVIYVKDDIQKTYKKFFQKSVDEYNEKQKQPCRKIKNYFEHISNGKREEAFYEIVVQFGDNESASTESETGQKTKEMLDEYLKGFQKRNPNLHIFNAVLHMDEATPHLHIDFIPFYTQNRKNGLSKGVSMKSALIEQGFNPKNSRKNQLVAWEESEREILKEILKRNGFSNEDKNAKYSHMSVSEFKNFQDEKKIIAELKRIKKVSDDEMSKEKISQLKTKIHSLEKENKNLEEKIISPYKSFYYSSPEKQSFVQSELDERKIPYIENENGFEAQECFIQQIREIEKQFKPKKNSSREKLRMDIDRLIMQCKTFDELLEKLKEKSYTVKMGKYVAVMPEGNKNFIRLKSLGEHYSEYALRNRINAKNNYQRNIEKQINSLEKGTPEFAVVKTIQIYTIAFSKGELPVKKKDETKPFFWTNDSEIDKILEINKKINSGATLETLRNDFEKIEHSISEKEKSLEKSKIDLKAFCDLKEKIEMIFENKKSTVFTVEQAEQTLKKYPNITSSNYRNVDKLVSNEQENIKKISSEIFDEQKNLKNISDEISTMEKILSGTYVQGLVMEERNKNKKVI